jgi:CRP-like cAMP-binding protein
MNSQMRRTRDFFTGRGERKVLADGEELYEEGSSATHVYYVQEGKLILTRGDASSREVIAEKRADSLVGEGAALDQGVRTVSALSSGSTIVLAVSATLFREALKQDAELCFEVTVEVARTLRSASSV